jgi:hypothetical protein
MSQIAELLKVSQRIAHLIDREQYGAVGKANAIPYAWKRRVEAISISARDGNWARDAKPEDIEVAKAIRAELSERYEVAGQRERSAEIAKISAELEHLRAVLPSIAAKAAIEAGVEARAISALKEPADA